MFSMNNLNPQATLVQSRVILFLHHIALLWSATINNSGSINIALLRSEDFCARLFSLSYFGGSKPRRFPLISASLSFAYSALKVLRPLRSRESREREF